MFFSNVRHPPTLKYIFKHNDVQLYLLTNYLNSSKQRLGYEQFQKYWFSNLAHINLKSRGSTVLGSSDLKYEVHFLRERILTDRSVSHTRAKRAGVYPHKIHKISIVLKFLCKKLELFKWFHIMKWFNIFVLFGWMKTFTTLKSLPQIIQNSQIAQQTSLTIKL